MAKAKAAKQETGEKLYRSSKNRMIGGVCGGIAEYFDADPTLVRVGWIVLTLITGLLFGVLGYIVAMIVIPERK